MKKMNLLFAAVLALLFLVLGCVRNNDNSWPKINTIPYTPQITMSFHTLFADLATTSESLTVRAGSDTTIFTTKGTKLHFYPNSFEDVAGVIISTGIVNIRITEMYTIGDMIRNGATTMAGDQPLVSGGQFNLVATLGGNAVYAHNYGVGFPQPGPSSGAMFLYAGSTNGTTGITSWQASPDTSTGKKASHTSNDSSSIMPWNSYYLFDSCSTFTFVNCDHPFTTGCSHFQSLVNFSDTQFTSQNSIAFICLPDYKTVISNAFFYNPGGSSLNGSFYAPAGTNYVLIVMSNIGGAYSYCQSSGIIPSTSDSLKISANMQPVTKLQIISNLSAL